jgi:hypothetical protein
MIETIPDIYEMLNVLHVTSSEKKILQSRSYIYFTGEETRLREVK